MKLHLFCLTFQGTAVRIMTNYMV